MNRNFAVLLIKLLSKHEVVGQIETSDIELPLLRPIYGPRS